MLRDSCARKPSPRVNVVLDKAERPDAELIALARQAAQAAETLLDDATAAVRRRVTVDHRLDERLPDREQRAVDGLAWPPTLCEYGGATPGQSRRARGRGRRDKGRGMR